MVQPAKPTPWRAIFARGGEMGARICAHDWSRSALGPMDGWLQSLSVTLATLLHARQPMFLFWGPELVQFYNDAYLPSLDAEHHPAILGQPARACWRDQWPMLCAPIDAVMRRGVPSCVVDKPVPLIRGGHSHEVYWTCGYSPVFDEHGHIAGTLVACTETTSRVLGERWFRTLRAFDEATAPCGDFESLLSAVSRVLEGERDDIPFWFVCVRDEPQRLRVFEADGVSQARAERLLSTLAAGRAPEVALAHAAESGAALDVPLSAASADPRGGAARVYVRALASEPHQLGGGFIVFGLGRRRAFDSAYRDFCDQLCNQLVRAHARIEALQARAAAVSERDELLQRAQAANRAKDEFLAMLGHELRNPLSPILTALQLIKLREGEATKELRVIERQVSHVVRLVDDLLDVSKITRGKVELRRELIEVCEVIGRAVEMASVLFEQRHHELKIDVPRRGLRVYGDPVRLAQVIANLLTNAARYTERGGRVHLSAACECDEVVIRVSDNGIGIAPDALSRIFELFVQGARSADRAEGGLGIGLSLVKNLVALHGGTVEAASEGLRKGSEFTIRLPLDRDTQQAAPDACTPLDRVGAGDKGKRILLVDDNVDAAELLAEVLTTAGHDVWVADDPLQALAELARSRPDLAILDIGLPVMDGYELAHRMRATAEGTDCRFIALTGYGQDHDRRRSEQAGFEAHLVKPVDLQKLLQLVAAEP